MVARKEGARKSGVRSEYTIFFSPTVKHNVKILFS